MSTYSSELLDTVDEATVEDPSEGVVVTSSEFVVVASVVLGSGVVSVELD